MRHFVKLPCCQQARLNPRLHRILCPRKKSTAAIRQRHWLVQHRLKLKLRMSRVTVLIDSACACQIYVSRPIAVAMVMASAIAITADGASV